MKKQAVLIIGGFTEFIEMYVRTISEYKKYEILIIDVECQKYYDILRYKENNKEHFSNLVTEYIKINSDEEILESLFFNVNNLKNNYDIVGVLPTKEKLIIHSAIIASYLNLPSIGLRAAVISRNKHMQRQLMSETKWGVDSKIVKREELNINNIPEVGVIKPANNHGSVDVYLWSNKEEAREVLDMILESDTKNFLLEEKIVGPEYSIESWVKNGEIIYSSITKKTTLQSSGVEFPVETGHQVHFQGFSKEEYDEINNMNRFVIEKSNVENSIVHLEFKMDSNKIPRVMEWAVRNPGDRIMDLYLYAKHINPYKLYIDIVLDKEIEEIKNVQIKTYQRYFTLSNDHMILDKIGEYDSFVMWPSRKSYKGFIRKLDGFTLEKGIKIYEIGILLSPEEEIKPIKDSFSRHCYIVYTVDNEFEENRNHEKIVEDFFHREFVSKRTENLV